MRKKTRSLTVSAMLAALAVGLLYAACVVPTARVAFIAVAGLATAAAVVEAGLWNALGCYACAAVLAFVLLPLRSVAFAYALFFGYYPVIKSVAERRRSRTVEYIIKFLVFNAALAAVYLLWRFGFMPEVELEPAWLLAVFAGGNLCFFLYDLCISRLAGLYLSRVHKKR